MSISTPLLASLSVIIVIGLFIFILSMCRSAALADKWMEEIERKEKENESRDL